MSAEIRCDPHHRAFAQVRSSECSAVDDGGHRRSRLMIGQNCNGNCNSCLNPPRIQTERLPVVEPARFRKKWQLHFVSAGTVECRNTAGMLNERVLPPGLTLITAGTARLPSK